MGPAQQQERHWDSVQRRETMYSTSATFGSWRLQQHSYPGKKNYCHLKAILIHIEADQLGE